MAKICADTLSDGPNDVLTESYSGGSGDDDDDNVDNDSYIAILSLELQEK
jgi:hypothetical protein